MAGRERKGRERESEEGQKRGGEMQDFFLTLVEGELAPKMTKVQI